MTVARLAAERRLVVISEVFAPEIGGVETMSELLARAAVGAGFSVTVITRTAAPSGEEADYPFSVRREGSLHTLLRLVLQADVIMHSGVTLRSSWLAAIPLLRKKSLLIVHTWVRRTDGQRGLPEWVKLAVIRCSRTAAVSSALARDLPGARVVYNAYRADLFEKPTVVERDRDILFVGRLVSDKGCDLLLAALEGMTGSPTVTIVGDGPELAALRRMTLDRRLTNVHFQGALSGPRLARAYASHRIVVVPSRWEEPFGLVAVEGLASGCLPVVARTGGLPEAVGAAGFTFRAGDAEDLRRVLERALDIGAISDRRAALIAAHLEQLTPQRMLEQYLALLPRGRR